MKRFTFQPGRQESVTFNPVADLRQDDLMALLRAVCADRTTQDEQTELDDQLEALVPAMIELRDKHGVNLNMRVLANMGTMEGFASLAHDARLSPLARQRCKAIHTRLTVQGVKAFLGHL